MEVVLCSNINPCSYERRNKYHAKCYETESIILIFQASCISITSSSSSLKEEDEEEKYSEMGNAILVSRYVLKKMAIGRVRLDLDQSTTEGPSRDVAVGLGRRRRRHIGRPVRPQYILPPRPKFRACMHLG